MVASPSMRSSSAYSRSWRTSTKNVSRRSSPALRMRWDGLSATRRSSLSDFDDLAHAHRRLQFAVSGASPPSPVRKPAGEPAGHPHVPEPWPARVPCVLKMTTRLVSRGTSAEARVLSTECPAAGSRSTAFRSARPCGWRSNMGALRSQRAVAGAE